jgi:hypothetical protein
MPNSVSSQEPNQPSQCSSLYVTTAEEDLDELLKKIEDKLNVCLTNPSNNLLDSPSQTQTFHSSLKINLN